MRVVVTGGAGFLGSHLVDLLLENGDEVLVIDDLSRGHREQVDSRAIFFEANICDPGVISSKCVEFNPDVIHHLAAVNGTRRFHRQADLVVDVNINGTRSAIAAAKACDSRLVFYSSPEAFGEQESMPLANSSESLFPPAHLHQRHSYGASKYLGELMCHHAITNGVDVRIVRPFNVYGPRLHGDNDGQVVAMMISSARSTGIIEVHGTGEQTRSLTWIGDVTPGLEKIGRLDNLSGMSFNLGSLEEIKMIDLANLIAKKTDATLKFVESNHGDSNRRLPDLSMNHHLDWAASTKLEDGLNQLL
ncbi:MAG TPA: NAD-dependent epimerase/dehydratase family protein [Candidatus Poseidoniales archaeon]|nr:MAG: hypothetical protein CXT71_01570 [Euryarchaeota archaeon]HIF45855.1 NAD-dependent epimerase/dehydratase family protein [Candidatus Poseidoniales archaeon]